MDNNLKQKTKSGLKWSAIERLATQLIQLIIMLILARMLGPTSIGLVGMLAIFIAIAQVLVDSGFSNALIRKEDTTQIDYSTAFYFNIVISLLCYLALFLSATHIAEFYQQPLLSDLLKYLGLVVIINGLSLIQKTKLTSLMDFKTQAKCSLSSVCLSSIVAIYLAFNSFGPWALVWQAITFSLANTILLNYFCKWLPALVFSKESFKYLFSFGSKLLVSSLLETIFNNIYQIIIGKIFTAKQVGLYTQANTLSYIPASSLTQIIQRVTYPMLSQIQSKKQQFEETYVLTLKLASCIVFPIILGISIIAKPLVLILLGNNWEPTAELLSLLCIGYMLYPIHAINLNLLQVKARTDLFLKLEIIKKLIITLFLIITIPLGIKAICIGIVIQSYLFLYINTIYTSKLIKLSQVEQIKVITPILIISLLSLSFSWLAMQVSNNLIVQIVTAIILAPLIYVILIKKFQPNIYYTIHSNFIRKKKI